MDTNFPHQSIPDTQPSKNRLPIAILLGFLTFVVTPVVAIIVATPFFFLGKISESLNPIVIIAGIFGLRELGGFFAAQFILIAFLALLGDFSTAIISWFINRSKKLATVTFVSALIFQFVSVVFVLPATIRKSQETVQSGIEREKSYQQYAQIGDVSFDVQEPYSDIEIGNRHPEYGPMYKKLRVLVPVSVSRPGVYQANVRYSFSKAGEFGSVPMKKVVATLGIGPQTMQAEFLAHEISSYGFWSPASVGGIAEVQLSYLASEKELFDSIGSDSTIEQKILEQFLKDEGLDEQEAQTRPTINKFIEKKEIHSLTGELTVPEFVKRNDIKLPAPPLTGELTVPEYVNVFLASSAEDNERVPVLVLSAVAGGGCDSASDLETQKTVSGNTMVVDIKGYKFTKGTGIGCPDVILESRAKVSIDLDWLKQNGGKEIIFNLGGQNNRYKISYNNYQVTLSGIQATNVVTNRPGHNPSDTPITLEMTLYPIDIAVMYLAGSVSSQKDYRSAMRDFARTKGFTPAEEIYSGLEQNEKTQFYVVLKNRSMPEPNRGEPLGELPNEGVGVYLKRVVSDADHY